MGAYEGKTTRLGPRCPQCDGAMSAGFLLDRDENSTFRRAEWAEGQPNSRPWVYGGGLELRGARRYAVTTYRCEGCGYLASYATEPLNDVQG